MRFHVIGMAHTHTTKAFSSCAYTQKIRGFCKMMHDRGHEVYLYAGEENDAPVTEHIVCLSEKERVKYVPGHYLKSEHSPTKPLWAMFNGRASAFVAERAVQGDFLCIIFGNCQKPIADAVTTPKCVEYGVGYHHTFAKHRVFESYAWMHTKYGQEGGTDRDGIWFDDVIPGYLDPADFPKPERQKDYLLYLGRIIERKGIKIASEVAKATKRHLIVAGTGDDPPAGCQYAGEVGYEERAKLLGEAYALLCPTKYIEPFGNVAIEAQACGTPVLTTDWGAFTETVEDGRTGFRCRSHQEFIDAVAACGKLNRDYIRYRAQTTYGLGHIGKEYERYFKRLTQLWGRGYYQLREKQHDQ